MIRTVGAFLFLLLLTAAASGTEYNDMSDKPYDRQIVNLRERPLSSSVNQAESYADQSARYLQRKTHDLRASTVDPLSGGPTTGFLGAGYMVIPTAPASMVVTIKEGTGFYDLPADCPADIDGVSRLDDLERYKPMVLLADETVTLTAADPIQARTDIIEICVDRRREDTVARDILDPATGVFGSAPVLETLGWSHDGRQSAVVDPAPSTAGIGYKEGIPGGAVPVVTAGYVKIAEIPVAAAAVTIVAGGVLDTRPLLFTGGVANIGVNLPLDWNGGGGFALVMVDLHAPPGVQVALWADPGNSWVGIYIVGGDLSAATATATSNVSVTATPNIVGGRAYYEATTILNGTLGVTGVAAFSWVGVTLLPGQTAQIIQIFPYVLTSPTAVPADTHGFLNVVDQFADIKASVQITLKP